MDGPLRSRRTTPGAPPVDREVDEELAFHLEMLTRRYMEDGLSREDARRRAEARFGNVGDVRSECREIGHRMEEEMRRVEVREELAQDVAYAWRLLRRSPAFTAIALVTIALGIGANTAIFSVVRGILLRPLPYHEPERVVAMWNGTAGGITAVAPPEFVDILERNRSFAALSAISRQTGNLTADCPSGSCEPERVVAHAVSPNFFRLLGVSPARGRDFRDEDGQEGAPRVVLLSHSLWMRRYGGDSAIVGRTIAVNGIPRTVIGVMRASTRFPDAPLGFLKERPELWIPYDWVRARTEERGNQYLGVIARLRPGITLDQARADLEVIASGFRSQFPERYGGSRGWHIVATPLPEELLGDARPALTVLMGAVGLVLLIACVNVANLLLARGAARRQELAVRTALGAGRGRIVRQLLTESAVLAVVGGVLGTVLAWQGVRLLVQLDPGRIPRLDEARIDLVVLFFSLAVSVVAGLLFGLAPALQQWRAAPQEALRAGGRGMAGEARGRMRRALVVAEVAMALVILIGAGLLVRSFTALQRVDPGFDASGVTTFQLALPRSRYDSTAKLRAFYLDLTSRLAALPGVERASAGYPLPMSEEGWSGSFYQEGVRISAGEPEPHAEYATVLPGYFRAMNIALRSGRDFTDGDTPDAGRVVIVDEALVARYFPGQSPLGRRIGTFGDAEQNMATIVGVVGHVHNAGPRSEGEPQIYLSHLQQTQGLMYAVVRSRLPGQPSPAELRAVVRAMDADLPVSRLRPMSELPARALAPTRFTALVLAIFAIVALVLASIGLYGVMSFLVAQRTQEIGIRMALGGHPRDVLRLVLRQGLSMAGAGIVIGLAAAFVLVRLASALLFGVGATDVPTYLGVSLLLVLVALIACYIPGRRATRVDPVTTMRL